ncbi:hypothetical protein [Natrinema salifodinae]|uniref:Uncharacterized protein n=1 Tax=Natrinema salifodinae TaxID=1202768 RepID=A0A1I0N748_9EURY|nr:hypothetical protein [Natrinema salifodinae]SEV96497.1 hypothetical protein SAMN05216285_1371 [Natrinema salifodinae]
MASGQSDSPTGYGFAGSLNWLISGALGGVTGSLIFGGVLWMIDPEVVTTGIPGIYGVRPSGPTGWLFHLIHGLVLGIVFGYLVTHDPLRRRLETSRDADRIASFGPTARFALAGIGYGLTIWAVVWVGRSLPLGPVQRIGALGFPVHPLVNAVGHLCYGLVLGTLFSFLIDLSPPDEEATAQYEDTPDSPGE